MAADKDLLLVAEIGTARGLRGEVRARSHTADPRALGDYGPLVAEDGRRFTITHVRTARGGVMVRFREVADRAAAEAIRGLRLYLGRDQLPDPEEDEFYHADLIGLDAFGPDGTLIGRVMAVRDFGAGDLFEIRLADGQSVLIPFTREIVPVVDIRKGRIEVVPPPGLLDQPDSRPGSRDTSE